MDSNMDSNRLAHQAWLGDIQLMLNGCTECWAFHMLTVLQRLAVISDADWRPVTVGVSVSSVRGL